MKVKIIMETQQGKTPKRFNHRYEGLKTAEGYGICSLCQCRENTDSAAAPCLPEEGRYYLDREKSSEFEEFHDIIDIRHDKNNFPYIHYGFPVSPTYLNDITKGCVISKIDKENIARSEQAS